MWAGVGCIGRACAAVLLKLSAFCFGCVGSLSFRVTCVGMSTTRNTPTGRPVQMGGAGKASQQRCPSGVTEEPPSPACAPMMPVGSPNPCVPHDPGHARKMNDRQLESLPGEQFTSLPVHKDWPKLEKLLTDVDTAHQEMRDYDTPGDA